MARNSRPIRIDTDLEAILKEIAKKNNISIRQASKELAKMSRIFKGNRIKETKEIVF